MLSINWHCKATNLQQYYSKDEGEQKNKKWDFRLKLMPSIIPSDSELLEQLEDKMFDLENEILQVKCYRYLSFLFYLKFYTSKMT